MPEINQDNPNNLADHLDDLLPPGRDDLPAFDLSDPTLEVARQLAGAEHPVMRADRVSQIEAQILARAAMQQGIKRRQIVRTLRWIAAASVLIVFAITLAVGVALLDNGNTHVIPPGGSAYESPATIDSAQPVSQPVIIHESRESSLFVIPLAP